MLTVETYLDKSAIHGIGCFTAQDIRKGEVVWKFHDDADLVIPLDKFHRMKDELSAPTFFQIKKYSYKPLGRDFLVLSLDDSRFFNHSETEYNVISVGEDIIVASRDIKKDEEIIDNYLVYNDQAYFKEMWGDDL